MEKIDYYSKKRKYIRINDYGPSINSARDIHFSACSTIILLAKGSEGTLDTIGKEECAHYFFSIIQYIAVHDVHRHQKQVKYLPSLTTSVNAFFFKGCTDTYIRYSKVVQ